MRDKNAAEKAQWQADKTKGRPTSRWRNARDQKKATGPSPAAAARAAGHAPSHRPKFGTMTPGTIPTAQLPRAPAGSRRPLLPPWAGLPWAGSSRTRAPVVWRLCVRRAVAGRRAAHRALPWPWRRRAPRPSALCARVGVPPGMKRRQKEARAAASGDGVALFGAAALGSKPGAGGGARSSSSFSGSRGPDAADASRWSPTQVAAWLGSVGLSILSAGFAAAEIDGAALLALQPSSFASVGVRALGHRKKLQAELSTLVAAHAAARSREAAAAANGDAAAVTAAAAAEWSCGQVISWLRRCEPPRSAPCPAPPRPAAALAPLLPSPARRPPSPPAAHTHTPRPQLRVPAHAATAPSAAPPRARSLGLPASVQKAFADQGVDGRELLSLQNEQLKALGVGALGHRKTILRQLASFASANGGGGGGGGPSTSPIVSGGKSLGSFASFGLRLPGGKKKGAAKPVSASPVAAKKKITITHSKPRSFKGAGYSSKCVGPTIHDHRALRPSCLAGALQSTRPRTRSLPLSPRPPLARRCCCGGGQWGTGPFRPHPRYHRCLFRGPPQATPPHATPSRPGPSPTRPQSRGGWRTARLTSKSSARISGRPCCSGGERSRIGPSSPSSARRPRSRPPSRRGVARERPRGRPRSTRASRRRGRHG